MENIEISHTTEKIVELQSILDGITEPLILINNELLVKRANKITLTFLGKSNFKEIIKQKCYKVLYGRNEICPYCPLNLKKSSIEKFDLNQLSSFSLSSEVLVKRETHSEVLSLTFFPLSRDGKIYSIVEKISNVTKIKEKEEENLRMRNLASLGILVSGVAHELNNPLTGISLTVQNLKNSLSNPDIELFKSRLDMIQKDLMQASMIVSDIISFAKTEKISYTYADLNLTVQKAAETMQRLYPALAKNIRWELHLESVPTFYFHPVKIERLFLNLFKNSLQAFDYHKGTIKVILNRKKKAMSIQIEDDAGGIPEEIIDKIFDPFFTKNKTREGTGLGLSICYSIIKEHNGKINVSSFDSKTFFKINLPLNPDTDRV